MGRARTEPADLRAKARLFQPDYAHCSNARLQKMVDIAFAGVRGCAPRLCFRIGLGGDIPNLSGNALARAIEVETSLDNRFGGAPPS